ncbi:hypothetical protein CERSUDRAFT_115213 [Gelatoporia subvermispora B]|uniref:Zn(2)-C6 fungal-type domain-containing protein n=1 Tax=Ceriporiopsis subvermispora (strain B) TaxID=914234 RepID=M2QGT2_CERS8|nr:hypothetical protein CERSUDRAFT_115213 [Gelatoporia subvermispora B]
MPGIQVTAGAHLGMPVENHMEFLPPPITGSHFVPGNNGNTGEDNGYARTSVSLPSSSSLSVPSLQAWSSATPTPSESSSVSAQSDPPVMSTARKQAKTTKRRSDRRAFGEACDRCSLRKISCKETVGGQCVACTRYARRHPDHVCTVDREIGKRGRPKGVKDGEGRTSRVAKDRKRASRKTKGIVTPDELVRKEVGMEEVISETGSQPTGFDVQRQQHNL